MITAYLMLCMLNLHIKDPCWPEKEVGHFKTEELCWASVDKYMAENGKAADRGSGPISLSWRCGGDT